MSAKIHWIHWLSKRPPLWWCVRVRERDDGIQLDGNQTAKCRWWSAHLRTSFCIKMERSSEEAQTQWSHSKRISIYFRFVFVMFLLCFVIFPKDKPQNEWWHWPRIPFFFHTRDNSLFKWSEKWSFWKFHTENMKTVSNIDIGGSSLVELSCPISHSQLVSV